jgi:hypothetical protein
MLPVFHTGCPRPFSILTLCYKGNAGFFTAKPKTHFAMWRSQQHTWRNNRGRFPAERSTYANLEPKTIHKAEAISKSLHGCKWQKLPAPEKLAIRELRSSPHVRLCKTDKGMGPGIVSDTIERQQRYMTL